MTRCEIIKHSAFLKIKVLPTIESLKIAQYYTQSHVGAWGKGGCGQWVVVGTPYIYIPILSGSQTSPKT